MKTIFRADASPEIGSGHIQRCLTIAGAFKAQGHECMFQTTHGTCDFIGERALKGFHLIDEGEVPDCDLFFVDHYGLDRSCESVARKNAKRIAVIDDLANRKHDCDILIDPTYGRDKADYVPLVPEECKVLCGADYAPLRPQFAALREQSLSRRTGAEGVKNILLFFSASDFSELTLKALEAIEGAFEEKVTVNLISKKSISFDSPKHEIVVHSYVEDMAALMAEADLAIGGGGTTSWERCSLGLPAIIAELADNQKKIAHELHEAGAVINLGWHADATVQGIENALKILLDDPGKLKKISRQAAGICDGQGVQRITGALFE